MSPSRPDDFDVVVFGDHFGDWLPNLRPEAPVWQQVPNVRSVSMRGDGWRGEDGDPATRLIVPLVERNIRACPAGWALVPAAAALETLADKAAFAAYIEAGKLDRYTPHTTQVPGAARFPAVVKRTDLFGGIGIDVVRDAAELTATLAGETFAGRPVIIQDFIDSGLEYVLQAVVVRGLFAWTEAFEVVIPPDRPIRHPNSREDVRIVEVPATELFAMQRIIAPLGFSGPVNFNYRRRPGQDPALFEINPRFGGSMFRPIARAALAAQLSAIIRNAAWHEPV